MQVLANIAAYSTLALAVAATVLISPQNALAVKSKDIVEKFDQIKESDNISQLIRSNSVHYWKYLREQESAFQGLGDYMKYEGIVAGDPHLGNFSVIPVKSLNGSRQMRFLNIDFDDGGRGPFIGDFIRFVIAAEAANSAIKKGALEEAYILGLQGEEVAPPKFLRDLLRMKVSDYDEMVEAYADRKTKKGRFEIKEGEIEEYTGDLEISDFAELLPEREILDIAVRPKERGGSKNSLRLWILTDSKSKGKRIYELKQWHESGLEAFQEQPELNDWYESMINAFWPGVDPEGYRVVQIKNRRFWLREKREVLIEIPYESQEFKDIEFVKQMSVYVANLLGLAHGRQDDARKYRSLVTKDPKAFHEVIEPVVKDYLEAAREALGN